MSVQKNRRSLIGNFTFAFEGIMESIGHMSGTVSKFSEAAEELGNATLVLSKSNTKVIILETTAKEQEKIKDLQEEYGDSIFNVVEEK